MRQAQTDGIDQVAEVEQAPPVRDAPQRQWQAPIDEAQERPEVAFDARPIDQWWPQDHNLHSGPAGKLPKLGLGFPLRNAVGIPGLGGTGFEQHFA